MSRTYLLAVLSLCACGASDPSSEPTPDRGPVGKADALAASCQGTKYDHCGSKSGAGCWCDELCAHYGDCCADVTSVCGFDQCDLDEPSCPLQAVCREGDDGLASCVETCGDGICEGDEDCSSCAEDCGECSLAPMPRTRFAPGAAFMGGRFYVGGGSPRAREDRRIVEAYDPVANAWEAHVEFEHGLSTFAMLASGGELYAVGGRRRSPFGSAATDALLRWHPSEEAWTEVAQLPEPRLSHAATVDADGRVYVVGGEASTTARPREVDVYDPNTNTWTRPTELPQWRRSLAATTGSDGRIYVIGGLMELENTARVDVYDPANGTWSEAAPLPVERSSAAAVTLPSGELLVLGGREGRDNWEASDTASVLVYDPGDDAWGEGPPMPTSRWGLAAATGDDGRVYAVGGSHGWLELDVIEVFDPVTSTWATSAN